MNIPMGDWEVKGTWHGGLDHEGSVVAILCCPNCGQDISLSGHTIHPDGTVDPSVVHAPQFKEVIHECGFHDLLRLLDWTGDPLKPMKRKAP